MHKNDPIGQAVADFYTTNKASKIIVHSPQFDDDEILVSYLFRTPEQMPKIEQKALALCKGSILDIGACTGAHALALEEQGHTVTTVEISALCCEVMRKRGIKNVINADIYSLNGTRYDTLLCLMNGAGLAGTMENLTRLLDRMNMLLNKGGQVLIDSSDLRYLFEDEDGSFLIDLNDAYYGEVTFQMAYKKIKGEWFSWLFIDPDSFAMVAEKCGFAFKLVFQGPHYDYLAQLIKK